LLGGESASGKSGGHGPLRDRKLAKEHAWVGQMIIPVYWHGMNRASHDATRSRKVLQQALDKLKKFVNKP
jgi:tmRNA-binding protein